ncbi:ribokinase [Nocardia sp. BMG51109]|uniref:ribokinase n=1 Tax=Nocardia sp. BMG51109 TaxID=1056816 RepID=UPI0005605B84|nr:ribokinase [Nocardia sp. BMG51109]
MARIVVVGSINMDLVATVGRRPEPGETVLGEGFRMVPGGKGANQAIAARRAGAEVEFVGAVGDDLFAGELRTVLADAGVRTRRLRSAAGPSGVASIVVDSTGENSIIVAGGANTTVTALGPDDLAAIAEADMVLCQLEIPVPTVLAAARHARASGTLVLLNPSPVQQLSRELWDVVDIAVVNEGEYEHLGPALAPVADVVVTRGAHGAVHRGPGGEHHHPGVAVRAVDTTGAGDAFTGALAAHWQEGPATALAWACTAGALATTKPGAGASIPDRAAIEAAMSPQPSSP